MCRWGCSLVDSTYMCKWCGTRYCKECLTGDFYGKMKEAGHCRVCNQKRCQGKRVEYVPRRDAASEETTGRAGRRGGGAASGGPGRRSAKSSKSARSAKSGKSSGGGKKKSGKKSAKKKRGKK